MPARECRNVAQPIHATNCVRLWNEVAFPLGRFFLDAGFYPETMMRIETELLGIINATSTSASQLQRKFLLKVTAEQLSQWLQCERRGAGKNAPFKISNHSTIRIDESIQRGRDNSGFLLQNPKKVMEIANTLLTPSKATIPRLYLGTLIWNVRPLPSVDMNSFFQIQKIEVEGRQPTWRLAFDTDAIYLTDSAHRHLGIVEAYKQFSSKPAEFSTFSPKFEFSVELYTLEKNREKELFSELNSKQKKISTAKQKEMDVSSPIGSLKDSIQDYDRTSQRLFYKNIEVSSNRNDKHTLVTMSVFVASIDAMFSNAEIKEARDDDDTRSDMSAYYCEFFYELANTIVVRADVGEGEKDYRPFRNLYTELIKPVEDTFDSTRPTDSETKLELARERAALQNRRLRQHDVANHNSFVKAFSTLGRYIRRMDHWRDVIARLQTGLNIPIGGKFFQKANSEFFESTTYGVPIASLNEDGTINVQVQTKTINAIYDYLLRKLKLMRNPLVLLPTEDGELTECAETHPHRHVIPAEAVSFSSVSLYFYLPRSVCDYEDGSVRLDIDGASEWPQATKKNKANGLPPVAVVIDEDYVDSEYQDIVRWKAAFEIPWPEGSSITSPSATVKLKFIFPRFEDVSDVDSTERTVEVSRATA